MGNSIIQNSLEIIYNNQSFEYLVFIYLGVFFLRINKCFVCNNLIFSLIKKVINADFKINEKNQFLDSYKCNQCEQTIICIKNIETLKTKKIWLELENERIRLKNLLESYKLKVKDRKNSQKVININTSKVEVIKDKLNDIEYSMRASITIRLQSSKSENWVQNHNLHKILRK